VAEELFDCSFKASVFPGSLKKGDSNVPTDHFYLLFTKLGNCSKTQRLVEHIFVFIQAVPKVPHFLKGASLEVSWSAEKYFLKVNIFYF
jgi:hypothetical protein